MLADRQDAYGHMVLDYLVGEAGQEVDERDDGYVATSGGPAAYFAPFGEWPRYQREGLRYVRGRVLDVGCGAGRAALHLQDRGHEVVGIDVAPLAVEVCRRRGVKDARVLSIAQVSRKLGVFDTVLMYGNNFGLFGSFRRARWLLRRFHGITSTDARIVAESRDPYQTDAPEHLAYHKRNRRRGRMGGQIRLRVRYRAYKTPWFDYLLVSHDEMQVILGGTGWRVRRFIAPEGSAYVAVIEKERL